MTEPIADSVVRKIGRAADLYHRLVMLMAPAGAGDVMLVVAERLLKRFTDQQMKINGRPHGQRRPSRPQATFFITNIWDETQSLYALKIAWPASSWLWPSIFPKCALGRPEAPDTVRSSIRH